MIERGHGARLAEHAQLRLFVARDRVGKDLDGHAAAEPVVAGEVDLAHAARAEEREDAVAAQDRRGGIGHAGIFTWGRDTLRARNP